MTSNADIIEAMLEAFNAQDMDAFCAHFAEDCIVGELNGATAYRGHAGLRSHFGATWEKHPQNRVWVTQRIAVGNTVVDHEFGERSPGGDGFEIIAVYTFRDGRIVRMETAR